MTLSLFVGICAFQAQSSAQIASTDDSADAAVSTAAEAAPSERRLARKAKREARREAAAARRAANSAENDETITSVNVEPGDGPASDLVCERVQRPGSRMARKVCYSRQQALANEAAQAEMTKEQLAELRREQRWRDEIIRQAEMSGTRPSGFGLGPD